MSVVRSVHRPVVLNVDFTSGGWGEGGEAPYAFEMSRAKPATCPRGLGSLIEEAKKNGGI